MRWRLAALVAIATAAAPTAALAGGHGFAVPAWMQRIMGQAPPEMQRMMQTPGMCQMMADPRPGMDKMMNAPGMQQAMRNAPQGLKQMMQSPGMQRMMNGAGSGH